jgi:uncharacterized protein YrrD
MLRSVKHLYGNELGALDGGIGHVKDFYFDDQNWVVRYVVVDTGTWLTGRLVLIAPHAFTDFDLDGVSGGVELTRKQIQESPALATHKPVSRQFQEEYYRYYGWPDYWKGDGLWGMGPYPNSEPMDDTQTPTPAHRDVPSPRSPDAHLRSTIALNGYHIQTHDGSIGEVTDFIIDAKSWAICHVVIETGQWLQSKEIVISPKQIERISYNESKIFVGVSRESIRKAPQYNVPPWSFSDSPFSTSKL